MSGLTQKQKRALDETRLWMRSAEGQAAIKKAAAEVKAFSDAQKAFLREAEPVLSHRKIGCVGGALRASL